MRLKTFSAPTMARAMELVRREMGDNAIIVSTQPGVDGSGARVTAALDDPAGDDNGSPDWAEENAASDDPADEVRTALSYHGTPPSLTERLIGAALPLAGEGSVMALAGALDAVFAFSPVAERAANKPLMLVGAPGVGKTIATAKLATRARRSGLPFTVITTDTRRAGGVEQLQAFTRILGSELITADSPQALADALAGAANAPAFIDTPGVNPYSDIDLDSLNELILAARAEPVIVLAAGGNALESAETAACFATLGGRRLLATRLDIARRFGSLLAAAEVPGLALSEVGISPHIADGLMAINPVSLARLILPHGAASTTTPYHREAAL